ncbi:MAG: hypothetical protein WBQ34_14780 [Candidatus Acidiferrales bacterium]
MLNNARLQFKLASPITEFDPDVYGTEFVVPVSTGGTFESGTSQSAFLQNRQYEVNDVVSVMRSIHTITFGGEMIHAHNGGDSKEYGGPIVLGEFKYNMCTRALSVCESSTYLKSGSLTLGGMVYKSSGNEAAPTRHLPLTNWGFDPTLSATALESVVTVFLNSNPHKSPKRSPWPARRFLWLSLNSRCTNTSSSTRLLALRKSCLLFKWQVQAQRFDVVGNNPQGKALEELHGRRTTAGLRHSC